MRRRRIDPQHVALGEGEGPLAHGEFAPSRQDHDDVLALVLERLFLGAPRGHRDLVRLELRIGGGWGGAQPDPVPGLVVGVVPAGVVGGEARGGDGRCLRELVRRGGAGAHAPECAGVIHSDLQRGFIRAEVIRRDELLELGSWNKAKEVGKLRVEGKDYEVQDGDTLEIRFNV